MVTKRDLVIAVLCTFCLTFTLFTILPAGSNYKASGIGEYDPWCDLDDDGKINIYDVVMVTSKYNTTGTPMNKTAKLLELQAGIDSLNATNLELQSRVDLLNASLFELQSKMEALETRIPKKGYISISTAAFTPAGNLGTFLKSGSYLKGEGGYYASVQLPDGVIVTNMSVGLYDSIDDPYIDVYLEAYNITWKCSLGDMASISTLGQGMPGDVLLHDDTISNAIIDNRNCEYNLYAYLSSNDNHLNLKGILLQYEYP